MTVRPMYGDGYIRVGDGSECMDVAIDIDDAYALRDTVVNLLAPFEAKVHGLQAVSGGVDQTYAKYKTFFGAKTHSIPQAEFASEPSIFIGAYLQQPADDTWQLSITRNRFARVDDGAAEQRLRTFFKIICWENQVVEAKRTIKLAKVVANLVLSDGSMTVEHRHKRVGFTTPIQPEDCVAMTSYIARHSKRIRHERGIGI